MHLTIKDRHYPRVKGWKREFKQMDLRNRCCLTIWQNRLQAETSQKDKDHFILIKQIIHQETITVLSICTKRWGIQFCNTPGNTNTPGKPQINPSTIAVGDFNTPLSPNGRSFWQKNNQKYWIKWHHRLKKIGDRTFYRTFYPNTAAHTVYILR